MSFHTRIAAWVVLSCALLLGVMIFVGYSQLEEELRAGMVDSSHPKKPGWTLHNSLREEEIQDILAELMTAWLWTALGIIVAAIGAGLLLARRSLLPVREINRQLTDMRPEALRGDIAISEADPTIESLARHLNLLLDRAGNAYRDMSEFASRVAHELRTPLMLLRLRVEHAPDGTPPEFQEELQDELGRLSRFVERSLLAVKAEQGKLKPTPTLCDISEVARDLANHYQLLADERELKFDVEIADHVRISADADLLRQALHGLLENAARYADRSIRLVVDAGPPPALHIFNDCDPETIAPGGLGLGLRLVHGICKASGWRIQSKTCHSDYSISIHFTPEPKQPKPATR
ncbi:MAG: histidine kinase dimerization/phospho-acceptor domain-containing protein [Luteolibacter sp.]